MGYRRKTHHRRKSSYKGRRPSNNKRSGFKKAEYNRTPQIQEKGRLTGRANAVFLRNKYQTELDNSHVSVVNMVHYIESDNKKIKENFNKAKSLKKNIEAHETERVRLYESLGNLLNKETNFEEEMWNKTLQKMKTKSVTFKQKFKDTDIDEIKYDAMTDYLKKYPEYTSKSTFKSILQQIQDKEREIREEKKRYNEMVSNYNTELSQVEKNIKKAEDKIEMYHKLLNEGTQKIKSTRYVGSIAYKIASERAKSEVNIDTIQHRIEQFTNTLDIIKKEYSEYKSKPFVEME